MRSTAIQSSTVETSSDADSRKLLETEREKSGKTHRMAIALAPVLRMLLI
jgi:hypothetical protein